MSKRIGGVDVAAVHVWYDETASGYCASLVDEEGNDLETFGGDDSLIEAWNIGQERAQALGIPCVEYARADGVETDRWEPEAAGARA